MMGLFIQKTPKQFYNIPAFLNKSGVIERQFLAGAFVRGGDTCENFLAGGLLVMIFGSIFVVYLHERLNLSLTSGFSN